MFRTTARFFAICLPLAVLAGCQQAKSANPLSPSIAGPIAGVSITSPKLLEPGISAQIPVDQQPVALMIENASTNGVRPVSYIFEIATDAGFTTKVFTQTGVQPGSGGRTTLKLPQSLTAERTYYWRAKGDDGANASDYSAAGNFRVYTPVIIQPPSLKEPGDGQTIPIRRPTLVIGNSQRSGPAGAMQYLIEVARDSAMADRILAALVDEGSNQTSFVMPDDLPYATRFYWRVKALDPSHESNFSTVQSVVTPPAPVVAAPSPGAGAPNPGTPVANDQINMSAAVIHNSPFDLASWPVTSAITRLDIRSSGVHAEFSAQNSWPNVRPPGWSGDLQWTLGMCLNLGGTWHCSAVVEFWHGLYEGGGPPSGYARDWFYDPIRWGPMANHQPARGEIIGFFGCAGDCRNNTRGDLSPVKERTNIVLVPMPDDGGMSQTFSIR
jgi:hypothetical protein